MPWHPSVMPKLGSILLNGPNMPENAWINCSDHASVLNMPRYSYNNIIIIVSNAIIVESLTGQYVHLGALLPFYLFLTRVKT